jgi:hypothetical protein
MATPHKVLAGIEFPPVSSRVRFGASALIRHANRKNTPSEPPILQGIRLAVTRRQVFG